ncbi:50S ribosomal protein L22 [Patescibacteria group bacterium]|nr:50S ribosomal protein L22 [Patescibacteria group bacterium]MCL5010566.1 50S ribosomal protein L22 [Patescibacteria group bacterium]
MEITVVNRSVRISPRKLRLIADSLTGKNVTSAMDSLNFVEKRGSFLIAGTLKSGLANALNNLRLEKENLYIKRIEINEGPSLKRYHPSTRGRIHPYKKRSSHIRVTLEEKGGKPKLT